MVKTILVINGPNLNMLGKREAEHYGCLTLSDIEKMIRVEAENAGLNVVLMQSNHEGEIIDRLHGCMNICDGIIINAGAYTHTSYAIRDAIELVALPTVEVHLSNVYARETFRHKSVIAPVCLGQISGLRAYGYVAALGALKAYFEKGEF